MENSCNCRSLALYYSERNGGAGGQDVALRCTFFSTHAPPIAPSQAEARAPMRASSRQSRAASTWNHLRLRICLTDQPPFRQSTSRLCISTGSSSRYQQQFEQIPPPICATPPTWPASTSPTTTAMPPSTPRVCRYPRPRVPEQPLLAVSLTAALSLRQIPERRADP